MTECPSWGIDDYNINDFDDDGDDDDDTVA